MKQITPPLDTIYLIHHSHTDFGFTHDQPIAWELHRRFIDSAIDLAERDENNLEDHAFRWTAETLAPVMFWLKHASTRQKERFLRLVHGGRIEVAAMWCHSLPIADTASRIRMAQMLREAREDYEIPIRHAMNADINGHNWPLVDVLLDAGVETLTMAINEFYGGAPFVRPNLFRWQSPSQQDLLVLNGWMYTFANYAGICPLRNEHGSLSRDPERSLSEQMAQLQQAVPILQKLLEKASWELPICMLQCTHPFGDNGTTNFQLNQLVEAWNKKGGIPRLKLATLSMWWDAVKAQRKSFSQVRGDWSDYWAFGLGACAQETAIARQAQRQLHSAEALFSMVSPIRKDKQTLGGTARFSTWPLHQQEAWRSLHLWNEHTFHADTSIQFPDSLDSQAQWNHKTNHAWTVHSLSKMMARDSVAELALMVPRHSATDVLIYNPLPWKRIISGPITDAIRYARGTSDDAIASRHFQDHDTPASSRLKPIEVPALGYVVVDQTHMGSVEKATDASHTVLQNKYHKIVFDPEKGGLISWKKGDDDQEWLDVKSLWKAGGVIREQPDKQGEGNPRRVFNSDQGMWTLEGHGRSWNPGWPAQRVAATRVISHEWQQLPDGECVVQRLAFTQSGCAEVSVRVFLPSYAPWVEFEVELMMGNHREPEAYYFALPFDFVNPEVRVDVGAQSVQLGKDQLPGTNADYSVIQKWADLGTDQSGMMIATPHNPLVMFDDFAFGANRSLFKAKGGLFLGWITNNYWDCNFPASQPGLVSARYRVQPRVGAFVEEQAHRLGWEAAQPAILHSLLESPLLPPSLPVKGSLLTLPEPPILLLEMSPVESTDESDRGLILLRFINASDQVVVAHMGSALLEMEQAQRCDFWGKAQEKLPLQEGAVAFIMKPRESVVIQIVVSQNKT
jgi:alpha-mannosidase